MITLIASYARNAQGKPVIGNNGSIPWNIPEDMKWFRAHTMHKTLVMGRKTYESIPGGALKNRNIVVLTTDADYALPVLPPQARTCHNWMELIEAYEHPDSPRLVVCGGSAVYKAFLPWASSVMLTEIHKVYEGDTFLPFEPNALSELHLFNLVMLEKNERKFRDEGPELEWTFKLYTRKLQHDDVCP